MAFELNPVALTSQPLLRAIQAGGWTSMVDLFTRAGRDPKNASRDVTILRNAGLIEAESIALTADGIDQLAALDRAGNPDAGTITADGVLMARHDQLEPHPLNPRKDFETAEAEDAIDELRDSLLTRGQLQNLVVRPQPTEGRYWIVAGESRWRAIGQAISDADWPEDRPIRCDLREIDDGEHLITALTENLQRRALSPIEEGEAFAAAVHEFGLPTGDLAAQIGKSQRYVQQRIALLKLSDEDRDRMRLPSDHPDHLNFKDARALTQSPREPGSSLPCNPADRPLPTQELTESLAVQPATKTFGDRITDKEALVIVELADRLERHPARDFDLYTAITRMPVGGAASSLVEKNIIGFRQRGTAAYATFRPVSSGAGPWLAELGFSDHRDDVLFEMRARVVGADRAAQVRAEGIYITEWLNVGQLSQRQSADPAPAPIGGGLVCRPDPTLTQAEIDEAYAASADRMDAIQRSPEPEQPQLFEETEAERAAREAAHFESTADRYARMVVETFSGRINDWMAFARFRRASMPDCETVTDHISFEPQAKPEDLAVALIRAIATGQLSEAGALLAVLHKRVPFGGATNTLAEMPADLIAQVIADARSPVTDPDPGE